jgi:SAM-dependent methyltransferase
MVGEELDRIRNAYRVRDRRSDGQPRRRDADLALAGHLHELEWQVLLALHAADVALAGSSLLDLGCGGGYILQRFIELGARDPVGVDLVPERVQGAQMRYPHLDVRCASADELPFDDATFDVVTQFMCLSSALDSSLRTRIAAEAWRILRPGGIVLSYDIRPSPRPLRVARRLMGGPPADAGTPTVAIGTGELRRLWGTEERLRIVQLNLDVARLVQGRRPAVAALRVLSPLRSHLLATFRKGLRPTKHPP